MAWKGATESLGAAAEGGEDTTVAEAAQAPGERVGGVYVVERLLGEGGGGRVYLVRHEGLGGARFALKVLRLQHGGSAAALAREGRLAARVSSAHVVKVVTLGQLRSGEPYLVMEYVEGLTLEGLLQVGELGTAAALDCARQLCLALEAAHGAGLVHGDVSLRNVFVTRKPDDSLHLQLGDFGLARPTGRSPGGTVSLELGGARGTPRFMAPEVISGDALDERSDLFALGAMLYRLLRGTFPFDGVTAREVLVETLRCEPLPLGRRRADLLACEPIVMRCLAAAPEERFGSARELREALEAGTAFTSPP